MNTAKRILGFGDLYYGWIIVFIASISMGFWLGIRNSFSVFYVALLEEFPWSRGDSAGVQSTAPISYTVLAPLVGGLIDPFGPRRVIIPGIVILALGLALRATIETVIQVLFFIILPFCPVDLPPESVRHPGMISVLRGRLQSTCLVPFQLTPRKP